MKKDKSIFDLSSKTILITGANGWLAKGFTKGLLSCGGSVILLDRDSDVENYAGELKKTYNPDTIASYVVDMFDTEQYQAVLHEVAKKRNVNVIINNAFSFGASNVETGLEGDFASLSQEQWKTAFDSGILWAVDTVKPFLPSMKKQKGGSIINICSMYALTAPNPKMYKGKWKKYLSQATYTTIKTGLLGLTRYMASFFAEDHVRCNAIAPGAFSKPSTDPQFIKNLEERIPLGRVGRPEDLSGAVAFLASEESSYITGQCLTVDGGLVNSL